MNEPKVDVQSSTGGWEQYADWPIPGTEDVNVRFRAGDEGAGSLALTPAKGSLRSSRSSTIRTSSSRQ